jgi:hypothetical protein
MIRWRSLLKSRRRIYLPLGVATALFVAASLGDMLLSHRRVIRFRAAWAYDSQHEECSRLALKYARIATQEKSEAERWPLGSPVRQRHLRDAEFASSLSVANRGVARFANATAKELRRLARTPP